MRDYVDVDDILLLDEENTGRLIEAIFAKMRRCFRTEKINIGIANCNNKLDTPW